MRLAVLEGHWGFRNSAMSVAPLFDMILSSHNIAADAYDYERWRTKRHLTEAIERHATSAQVIYLGGHAETSGVEVRRGETLSSAEIAACVASAGPDGAVSGLYISMCSIGTKEVADFILETCPTLEWVAGYGSSVDWAESAAIDLLFFNQWLGQDNRGSRRIKKVAAYLAEWTRDLTRASDVGFNIYTRAGAGIADERLRA